MNIWLLTNPRCGSQLLSWFLNNSGLIGKSNFGEHFVQINGRELKPRKQFDDNPLDFNHSVVHRKQFVKLFNDSERNIIESKLPDLRYIHLNRRNIIEQAVSLYFAEATNVWSLPQKKEYLQLHQHDFFTKNEYEKIPVLIDDNRLLSCYYKCQKHNDNWAGYLQQTKHCSLWYEDLVTHTKEQLIKIFAFLNLTYQEDDLQKLVISPGLQKMNREETQKCCLRLRQLIGQFL